MALACLSDGVCVWKLISKRPAASIYLCSRSYPEEGVVGAAIAPPKSVGTSAFCFEFAVTNRCRPGPLDSNMQGCCLKSDALTLQARSWDQLPENARKYVQRVQELIGVECRWIGVGPGRDAIVLQPPTPLSQNGSQSRQRGVAAAAS